MCMHTYVYILYVITDNYVYYIVKIYNYIYLKGQKSSCLWKNILPEKNIRLQNNILQFNAKKYF